MSYKCKMQFFRNYHIILVLRQFRWWIFIVKN